MLLGNSIHCNPHLLHYRYEAGEFVHCMGDAHVYLDHIDALSVQVTRTPNSFPTCLIQKESIPVEEMIQNGAPQDQIVDAALAMLENFVFDDFKVVGYQPHAKIVMKMSA